jgi:hypothetical protein
MRAETARGPRLCYVLTAPSAPGNQQSAISNQQSATSNQQSATSNQQPAISNLKTISPCLTLRSNRDKSGDGSSPSSLSRACIRRLLRGCRLPDAILHGKRSLRPRSRAVQRLAATGFRVRLFSSLGLVVAPPACEPGEDTSATYLPRLHRLAPGRLPLLTGRSPGATGLASSLSGCLSFSVRRCRF